MAVLADRALAADSPGTRWLFLAAYLLSGLAGLIYQVTWARLMTLYMGHTTAAAGTVVAAFMGGLAAGAALGGRVAPSLSRLQCLHAYILLESAVALLALLLPSELAALRPVLAWSYQDGAPGAAFPAIRLLSCLVVILVPATALGATFPIAIRWYVGESDPIGRAGGELYAVNTIGAAIGALAAGFVLIPAIGISGTTLAGVAASALAIAGVVVTRVTVVPTNGQPPAVSPQERKRAVNPRGAARGPTRREQAPALERRWLAGVVLGLSGFATLTYEIAWIRVFSLIVGPTTYAAAATLAALIAGTALGSAIGALIAGRGRSLRLWLVFALSGAALAVGAASSMAGTYLPHLVAQEIARSSDASGRLMTLQSMLAAALVVPAATCLGTAFPLALGMIRAGEGVARRIGAVYAINTLAAVTGSLVAAFVAIPFYGLQFTLGVVSGVLIVAALVVVACGRLGRTSGLVGLLPLTAAAGMLLLGPRWDRDLLASGAYKYAPSAANDIDRESILKAGELLYYRDGAAATVSVKRAAGTQSLAIDGKVDASNSGDMLTQKLLAHLPLLLHPNARDVAIIGLGSGVTLASALVHPIARADVVEISPEVIEASQYFAADNRNALEDARTRLIRGDGRTHLLLSSRKYDVIISEPSNPWMAGVAALFTREFFAAARGRLAPGGILCQWAHTYSISEADLRSIAATFASVFPDGTMWLVGEADLLLIASTAPLEPLLPNIDGGWQRAVADLSAAGAVEPFAVWSLFVGGPQELRRYAAGAALQTDDRMALEFSGPRALNDAAAAAGIVSELRALLDSQAGPALVRHAHATAGSAQWRIRGVMMRKAGDDATAFEDYMRAATLDPADAAALDGLVDAAVSTGREAQALEALKTLPAFVHANPALPDILIATSRLLAAGGSYEEAVAAARQASSLSQGDARPWKQLAAMFADLEDAAQLDIAVKQLQRSDPAGAATHYYAAGVKLLHGQHGEALSLAQEAIRVDPQFTPAYKLLGTVYSALGHPEAARDAFQAALRLEPRDSTIHANLGVLELTTANWAAAEAYFAVALMLDPTSAPAREGLARAKQGAAN